MPIAERASARAANTPNSTPVKRGVDSVALTTSSIVRTSAMGRLASSSRIACLMGPMSETGSPDALTTRFIERIGLPTDRCHWVCGT
jgi:hypothetical protein